jgi:predicted XRE-type DNA-binding protein
MSSTKVYTEAKTVADLAKALKLPKGQAAKIEMRTDLVIAIKRCVEKKGITHAEAAERAKVGRTVITAILNGNTTHVSTDRLIDIAQNLGLTVTLKVA